MKISLNATKTETVTKVEATDFAGHANPAKREYDSSCLNCYMTCPRRYKYRYIDMLEKTESNAVPYRIGKLSKSGLFNPTYMDIIRKAEWVLEKILPGIHRFKEDYFRIQSIQSKLHTKVIKHIDKCTIQKNIVNSFHLYRILDFDKNWNNRHELSNWVTEEKWVYYLNVILNSYIFCEFCGNTEQKRKCLGPVQHALGVLYTLKSGYSIVREIGGIEIEFKIIPEDVYLNQYGVILEENKLSTYIGPNARKLQKNGKEMFEGFLYHGTKIMSPFDLRNLIFM